MIPIKASTRQRRIIELLLDQKHEITAADIAAIVGTSTRTIHRELSDIEPLLAANGILLHKISGLGIRIEADNETLERFKQSFDLTDSFEYSAEERQILILCRLLKHDEPIKLFSLAHELRVAIPTISHDLDELEQSIIKQGLTLVRKRGYGVEISGPEAAKRHFISLLAFNHFDDSDLFGQFTDQTVSHPNPITAQLLDMIGKKNFKRLEQALWELNDDWPNDLSESDYTRLLIKLSVALTRIEHNHLIQSGDYSTGGEIPLLRSLLNALDIQLPIEEKRYLSRLLDNEAFPESSLLIHHDDMSLIETVTLLIRYVEEQLQMPLLEDRSLVEGLIQHIKKAFQRIREGIAIRNPMLAPIKKDYAQLFAAVRQGVNEVIPSIVVPDEEIGYIVMHFGASIERLKQFPRKIRAVLVCTSGIGSSKLLAVRITKKLPQIELLGHYSWYEAARLPSHQYDLIISTVDLPLDSGQYIKLSPLLTQEETDKLRSYIESTTLKRLVPASASEPSMHSPMDRLTLLQQYSGSILRLLESFTVHDLAITEPQSKLETQLLPMISLIGKPDILAHSEKIAAQLLAREQQGSLVIPDTELALIHTRSEWIQEPLLALYRYDKPLLLNDDEEIKAKQVLMMLGPVKLDKSSLEVLSEISAMLLLPEMIAVLEHDPAESIKLFISQKLELYIKTKMDWRE
ncbi:BglG family transcription antiterminator [Paenibacillus prosopidis]|uniref:Mannitol operon transcriptional antiterminator n=1 Tax=Paenibacillus prosopidis TaxID=630520 RepID=A0A368W0J1_9BACL|nr:BglG family transcription antiterminator [Paenibacillus prosopidis]RCW47904.1 mannitol operon transcriptional antiterminator [Paenibacillus prosopidis]